MNKLPFLLLALVPFLLVLAHPLANAQLPFLPGTGNLTQSPMPQVTSNSNLTASMPTTASNLSAAQCGILPCGPGDNAANSPYLPHSLIQSIIKQTQTSNLQMKKALNATGPAYTDTTSVQDITERVNSELKNGTISSNGTFLVIYAYYSLGPVGWQGSINSGGNSATQDGSGRAVIPISCGSAMSFQNQGGSGYLALSAVNNAKIVNELLTTSPYGVVTMVANCSGGAPQVPTVNQSTPKVNQTSNQNIPNQLRTSGMASASNNSSSNTPIEVEDIGGTLYVLESNGLRYGADAPWDEFYHVEILYPNGTLIWNGTQHWVNQIKYCTDTTTPMQDKFSAHVPDCSKPIYPEFGVRNFGNMADALNHRTLIVKCPGTPQNHC